MAGRIAIDLDATEIVDAAIGLLQEQGIDAVSMRNVGARLGVSPVPLYSRIGNKAALLDAVVDRLLTDMAPPPIADERWQDYATRWCHAVRTRFVGLAAAGLGVGDRRPAIVEATRPLLAVLRGHGCPTDRAVQATRILVWTVAGFASIDARGESLPGRTASTGRTDDSDRPGGAARPGSDPAGVSSAETDHLFGINIRYVIDGIERDQEAQT